MVVGTFADHILPLYWLEDRSLVPSGSFACYWNRYGSTHSTCCLATELLNKTRNILILFIVGLGGLSVTFHEIKVRGFKPG